ncbi:MAG: hypothetical protein ACRDQF_07220 [Thermocrispum sp.]
MGIGGIVEPARLGQPVSVAVTGTIDRKLGDLRVVQDFRQIIIDEPLSSLERRRIDCGNRIEGKALQTVVASAC